MYFPGYFIVFWLLLQNMPHELFQEEHTQQLYGQTSTFLIEILSFTNLIFLSASSFFHKTPSLRVSVQALYKLSTLIIKNELETKCTIGSFQRKKKKICYFYDFYCCRIWGIWVSWNNGTILTAPINSAPLLCKYASNIERAPLSFQLMVLEPYF